MNARSSLHVQQAAGMSAAGRQAAPGADASALGARAGQWLRNVWDALRVMRNRSRERAQLARFDDLMLRDIRLTRMDRYNEVNKWPWQA
jgi:uncharacterized protein YjiS (DUF1127 family)